MPADCTMRARCSTPSPTSTSCCSTSRCPTAPAWPRCRPCATPHRRTRTVVLSADDRPEIVLAAIDAGAAGFIPKATESRLLREALATVLRGGVYVPPITLAASPPPPGQPASAERLGLTPRQIDVLRMLVDGRSNKLIGRALDLSPSTVKTHLEAIFQRLQVNSRTQAVVAAARCGLKL